MPDPIPDIEIRPLKACDGPIIAEFYASLTPRDSWFFYPHPLDDEHAAKLAADAENPDLIALLAVEQTPEGERMDGYAYIRRNPGGDWWFGICVRPDRQEHRIGSRMLARLMTCAHQRGIQRIGLHVHLDNPRGQKLYRRYGFRPVETVINRSQGVGQYIMISQVQSYPDPVAPAVSG